MAFRVEECAQVKTADPDIIDIDIHFFFLDEKIFSGKKLNLGCDDGANGPNLV
jgi:hypothetical protein